jgi:hypothetical protein
LAQAPGLPETIAVVSVADPPGPTADLAELARQLRAAIVDKTPGVLEMSQVRDRMTGQTSSATLTELDRAYAGAVATYQSGDYEGSVRTLRAVIDDLDKLPESAEAFDQWTRAVTRLARAQQTLGRKDEATAAMDRLVRAAPAVKVDSTQYPPSFAKQIDEAKARLKNMPKRKLTIQSPVKGAKVFLDGREIGTAPMTIGVPAGVYGVSGKLGDLRIPRFGVDLRSEDQTVPLNVDAVGAMRPSNGPGLAVSATDRLKSLVTAGALLGLDKLVAATLVVQGDVTYLAGSFYDVRRGMLLREGQVRLSNRQIPPGHLADLANFLVTGQRGNSVVVPLPLPVAAPIAPKKAEPAVARQQPTALPSTVEASAGRSKALGWTAFGAGIGGVAFGAFAVVEGLSAKSNYNDARNMLQGNSLQVGADPARYNAAVSSGDSAKTRAFIGAGVAVGALAVGGVLGYMSYKQTGEVGPFRF